MVMKKNRGFSLIELMIVVAIIGILVAVALPQFTSMSEDAKISKVKQDLDVYVNSIIRFKAQEPRPLTGIKDLLGKYVANEMKDPWGNEYQLDLENGCCFSMGADGKQKTADDIVSSYLPPLMPIKAKLVDCGLRSNAGSLGLGDRLEITFSRPLHPSMGNVVKAWVGAQDDSLFSFGFDDDDGNFVPVTVGADAMDADPPTIDSPMGQPPSGDPVADKYVTDFTSKTIKMRDDLPTDDPKTNNFVEGSPDGLPFAYIPFADPSKVIIYFGDGPKLIPGQMYINVADVNPLIDNANQGEQVECNPCSPSPTPLKLQF